MKRTIQMLATSIVALGVFGALAVGASPGDPATMPPPDTRQPADNADVNVRDRHVSKPTAGQQSNDARDVKLTRAIRKAVVDDDSLSVYAHNVRIVTRTGVVILRGPVKSEQERNKIAEKARRVPGVVRVDNQLEIGG